jgi:hypothetical protein
MHMQLDRRRQIFSLWTVSGRDHGGLSFASKDVGQVLTVAGNSTTKNMISKKRKCMIYTKKNFKEQ